MNIEDTLPDEPCSVRFEQLASSLDKFVQRRARMMLALIARLHDDPAPITLFGMVFKDELWLTGRNASSCKVWVDAPDFAPFVDGFPPYHYRIESDGDAFKTPTVDEAIPYIIKLFTP